MCRYRTTAALLLVAAACSVSSHVAHAQPVVSASPDIQIELGAGLLANDHDVVLDNQLGIVVLEDLGVLPGASDVIAYGLNTLGDRLLAFDITTLLPGGLVARPGDVVRYDGVNYSIEFDAAMSGLPAGVAVDATSLTVGGLLLSFDTTVDLGGGVLATDEDLVRWDGAGYSIILDGSAIGLASSLDVDGAQHLGQDTFLLSFDTTGVAGGVTFDDEDIVRFDGSSWTMEYDASAASSNWAPADLNALMVPEPAAMTALVAGCVLLVALDRRRTE